MKSYTVQGILNNQPKEIQPPKETIQIIQKWEELFEKQIGKKPNDLDYFILGQSLSNPIVREEFKKLLDKEIKYDNRVWK